MVARILSWWWNNRDHNRRPHVYLMKTVDRDSSSLQPPGHPGGVASSTRERSGAYRDKDAVCNQKDQQERDAIRAVLSGNANAYRVIVDRYQSPIYNLMLRMSRSESEALDLSQEAFIKAYENIKSFDGRARFFPWLYSISLNLARDHLRRMKIAPVCYEADPEMEVSDHAEESERMCLRLDAVRLGATLQKLPEDYREAVMLRYHHELSLQEVADALGLSLSGAKMRVSRGLERLRLMFRERNHEIR